MTNASEQTEYAIEAKGLSKHFGNNIAVNKLDLNIPKGSIYGFLGPNGCGKSTSIRLLTGLLEASEGDVTILGKPLLGHEESLKKRIGYMTQKFSLYDDLTVQENLNFVGAIYGFAGKRKKARLEELLALYDLEKQAKQFAGSMSGGQKQRLALACATLHSPELLFLDEQPLRLIQKIVVNSGKDCSTFVPLAPLFWCPPITWMKPNAVTPWQLWKKVINAPMARLKP
jgi:ABC-2 type transport system ATP-binding protein